MVDTIERALAAAKGMGKVTDMDVLDYGDGRKMALFTGVTDTGAEFELELKVGFRKDEQEAQEK